jgi:hypothetical protein
MNMLQQETEFKPIEIVLETREEIDLLWEVFNASQEAWLGDKAIAMRRKISDFLSNEAKL